MKITNVLLVLIVSLFCFKGTAQAVLTWDEIENYIANYSESNVVESLLKYDSSKMALNYAMNAKDYFSVVMMVEYGININFRNSLGIISQTTYCY